MPCISFDLYQSLFGYVRHFPLLYFSAFDYIFVDMCCLTFWGRWNIILRHFTKFSFFLCVYSATWQKTTHLNFCNIYIFIICLHLYAFASFLRVIKHGTWVVLWSFQLFLAVFKCYLSESSILHKDFTGFGYCNGFSHGLTF